MTDPPLLALAQNASLLLAVVIVSEIIVERTTSARGALRQVLLGVLVGCAGMAVMLSPWHFQPGIVFDTRSVLLAVSGRLFGLVPTAVAMAMTAAMRLQIGGDAAWTGVAVIAASGGIGLAWRHLRRGRQEGTRFAEHYLLGIVVHVAMLALMLTLPRETALRVLGAIGLPVLAVYPLVTALLGTIIERRIRRSQLAERMIEAEERLRLALSAAGQGLFDLDLRTGETSINAEYATMLGYDPAAFRVNFDTWTALLNPDDREPVMATFRDYVAGKVPAYRIEFRMRSADGGWRWILSQGSIAVRDAQGAPLRMLGTHTDISGRKEIEERLRTAENEAKRLLAASDQSRLVLLGIVEDLRSAEARLANSEAFYRGLFENMHEGFAFCRMVYDNGVPADFTYLRVNRSFERMRGLSDVEGRNASEVIPTIRDSNPELLERYGRVAMSGQPETFELNLARLDKWLLVSVFSPKKDHFVAAFTDISERKRVEMENAQRLAELQRWYKATLGREDRVMRLKAEVNGLERELGRPPRYHALDPGSTDTKEPA